MKSWGKDITKRPVTDWTPLRVYKLSVVTMLVILVLGSEAEDQEFEIILGCVAQGVSG